MFLFFLRKQDLTFHANCLERIHGDNLQEMSNSVFWEKIRRNIKNLSSAELALSVVKVKILCTKLADGKFITRV